AVIPVFAVEDVAVLAVVAVLILAGHVFGVLLGGPGEPVVDLQGLEALGLSVLVGEFKEDLSAGLGVLTLAGRGEWRRQGGHGEEKQQAAHERLLWLGDRRQKRQRNRPVWERQGEAAPGASWAPGRPARSASAVPSPRACPSCRAGPEGQNKLIRPLRHR